MDAERVALTIKVTAGVFALIGAYFYLTQPAYDYGPPRWRRWLSRYLMSRAETEARRDPSLQADNSPATTTPQTSNNGIAMPATDSNALLRAKAEALAAMVHAGKIGETEGIRLVFGVAPSSSNPRYLAARAALKEELDRLAPPKFRPLDEQRRPA
jgi:hypothetical protein